MEFREKLKYLIRSRGWSQKRLADELESVSKSKVSDWVIGRFVPDLNELRQLARIFDVSLDYLVFPEVEEPRTHPLNEDQRYLLRTYSILDLSPEEAVRAMIKAQEGKKSPEGPPPGGGVGRSVIARDLAAERKKSGPKKD